MKIAVEILVKISEGRNDPPRVFKLINTLDLGFPRFIRNTFNRVFCYCLKYSNNKIYYSYLKAVSRAFASMMLTFFLRSVTYFLGVSRFMTVCEK
jgi:hypothetical protein